VRFDYSSLFSDAQVEKVRNSGEKIWKLEELSDENQSAMKLSQICQKIELCLREIILCFQINLQNLLFSLKFNSYSWFCLNIYILFIAMLDCFPIWTTLNFWSPPFFASDVKRRTKHRKVRNFYVFTHDTLYEIECQTCFQNWKWNPIPNSSL
jgi:hypothetical protein